MAHNKLFRIDPFHLSQTPQPTTLAAFASNYTLTRCDSAETKIDAILQLSIKYLYRLSQRNHSIRIEGINTRG